MNSRPVGLIDSGRVLYIEAGHLGSPRVVIDPVRNVAVWRWSLLGESFGHGTLSTDPDQDGVSLALDLRFPGQRHDAASGLTYNYYRDYDPAVGRYAQSDPLGQLVGPDTYGYASANPFLRSDDYGLADRELGDHVSGQTIDCGKGCTIRVDFRLDIKTGQRVRHLHWKCKSGEKGVCGENGDESHDGRWEDAPRHIKECAIRNGFAGAPSPSPDRQPGPRFNGLDQTPGSKSATVGGTLIVIGAFVLWLVGG